MALYLLWPSSRVEEDRVATTFLESSIPRCAPLLVGPTHGPLIPRPPHLATSSQPLVYSPTLLETYESRVRALLCYPFARRFLTMGGIVWRIALHYGPSSLLSAALSGPSTDAYIHYHVDHAGPYIDDTVSQADINLLLGSTNKGSFWPTLNTWTKTQKWHGEWSSENEVWFQNRLRDMHSRKEDAVVTHAQWDRKCRKHTAHTLSNPQTIGTEAQAAYLCCQVEGLYPTTNSYDVL
ncbi:hypothetical protein BDR04DRAFT_1165043 [Suillus decipiens]|nr:hypothetical protein BDR04DRAFT_1165043 [Suillus decipiens]